MLPNEIMVSIQNGKCCLTIPYGYNDKIKPSDAKLLIPMIEQYIAENTDEAIEQENYEQSVEFKQEYAKTIQEYAKTIKDSHSGYVYLFECGGRYKIGYSHNVEKRLKQLDTRPYQLNFIAKIYSDIAYEVEQEIHKKLEPCKVANEWYEFKSHITPDKFAELVKYVEKTIKEAKR